ncbi:MAG: hemerythrin [Candidatus Eisenbacteria bacterium]|nr:hemerythrin [Candidatus Eisenbacteria bacterium]
MDPIYLLMNEHQLILKVLTALESYAARVEKGEDVPRADLESFTEFIRNFADACHHGKEEDVLFEVMAENGFPKEMGPIGVMLQEHDVGRRYVTTLRSAVEAEGDWDPERRNAVVQAARGYVNLLREHIHKEDNILYPMAGTQLSSEAMQKVAEECAKVEKTYADDGSKARLEATARDLIQRYGA